MPTRPAPLTRLLVLILTALLLTLSGCAPVLATTLPTTPALALPSAPPATLPPAVSATAAPTVLPQSDADRPRSATATLSPARYRVEVVASGLNIPWALAWDAQGDLYFTERPGRLRVIRDGLLDPAPLASFAVAQTGEGGLLGLVLDPQFKANGYLYVMYTVTGASGNTNRIARITLTANGAGDERVLVDNIPGAIYHDGGRLAIGPDYKLYATTGDARNLDLPQNAASLAGKILRLNLDGSVPADNPTPGSLVYSLGHRNPQGLAWQPATGVLWSTEHGPSGEFGQCCQDELNRIVPNGNYGWPLVTTGSDDPRYVHPVLHSGTSDTWAPGGLAFYDGGLWPQWQGDALISALRGSKILRVALGGPAHDQVLETEVLVDGSYGRIREVAIGPDGLIYFTTSNRDGRGRPDAEDDRILRLVPEGQAWLALIVGG